MGAEAVNDVGPNLLTGPRDRNQRMNSSRLEMAERPLRRLGERVWEQDFEESPEFDDRWWTGVTRGPEPGEHYAGRCRKVEVVRAKLKLSTRISEAFRDVLTPRQGFVEIVFFEVATSQRRRGFGRAAVNELVGLHPGRSIAAFSEGADLFWASLGWARFEHEEGTVHHRPLYVLTRTPQPASRGPRVR
jgi:hypothetical protein